MLEISRSALRVVSPACNDGVVVEGGLVRILIISLAACLRKSSKCISGKAISVGKNVTVFESRSLLVLGK